MNLFVNPAEEWVAKATSPDLPIGTQDFETQLEISYLIRAQKISPKQYSDAIKKRLQDKNANVQLLALKLTDTLVKNSGVGFIKEMTSKGFVDLLVMIIRQ